MTHLFHKFSHRVNWSAIQTSNSSNLELVDNARVGVIGAGPAGSFFSYFLLDRAERLGRMIHVDIFDPKDFSRPGPHGCNMCGGIISESLVQKLATEGISLPPTIVQRAMDSYMLHTDLGSVRIETPIEEKRIGAVSRGAGPLGLKKLKWDSFDGYLQKLATNKGARLINKKVDDIKWENERPQIVTRDGTLRTYDLLVVASGINSSIYKLFPKLVPSYKPPNITRTFIHEYFMGEEILSKYMGSSMHIFLLDIPRLEFAALIPKGDYLSVCLLGEEIDRQLTRSFLDSREVKHSLPPNRGLDLAACQCAPRINIKGAVQPYADRVVFIGDAGVSRLYKDGIGAAYRTAKAAAATAIFEGISASKFRKFYWPTCEAIERDNTIGKMIFAITRQIQKRQFARVTVIEMINHEQNKEGKYRRMSMLLWDLFTGSATYREIFIRALHPLFILRFSWEMTKALIKTNKREPLEIDP